MSSKKNKNNPKKIADQIIEGNKTLHAYPKSMQQKIVRNMVKNHGRVATRAAVGSYLDSVMPGPRE